MASDKPGFFEELKRRHVWRIAAGYVVTAWLIVQVATQVFPFFRIPDWGVRFVVILVAIGFPVVVVFAWVYELTPEGVRRTEPADSPAARPDLATRQIGRRMNAAIIAVLVLAVAMLGWRLAAVSDHPAPDAGTVATQVPAAASTAQPANPSGTHAAVTSAPTSVAPLPGSTAAIPAKSVAVLPFTNESGQKDQQYFSDGLSEDLITALSQFAGLKVISRNSAFQFRNSKDSSAKIGQLLGVAHLLEGSVQRAGDTVRITATLVNAGDGSIVWSQRYDKPWKDLFALQDAITAAVADALKAKLLLAPGAVVQSDRPPSGNLAAYAAFQRGRAYNGLQTAASMHKAIAAFQQAIGLDPHYAAAYAGLSTAWQNLAVNGFLTDPASVAQAWSNARKASATALEIDPDSAVAHRARAALLRDADFDWAGAAAEYRRVLQLQPNAPGPQASLGVLLAALGQVQQAAAINRNAIARDPRHEGYRLQLGVYLLALGQGAAAQRIFTAASTPVPGVQMPGVQMGLVTIDIVNGDAKDALGVARQIPPGPWRDYAMTMALQVGPDRAAADEALQSLVAKYADTGAYQIAEVYALRRDPDNMFKWLDRAWANRDTGITGLLYDPIILRYRDDPRFAAFAKKVGLPTTTDAVAMK